MASDVSQKNGYMQANITEIQVRGWSETLLRKIEIFEKREMKNRHYG